MYRGTSLIRNRRSIGPYSRPIPRALGWSYGVGIFLSARYLVRSIDVSLPGKGNSNSHGVRPVHLIITMIVDSDQ